MAIAWKAEEGTLSSMEETSLNGEKWYVERFSNLKPGEKTMVSLELPISELAFYNAYMRKVVEPGEFEIQVGSSSDRIHFKNTIVVK